MRNKIFISHATPNDNDFTRWLALKLITLGYDVWCDVFYLGKGVDFWKTIETEIRDNTIQFFVVMSAISNSREGVLKEITVAQKTQKALNDATFVVPLMIDNDLSYDDINIDVVRLNAIDFKKSWAIGLQDVIKFLEDKGINPNKTDAEKANSLYEQIFLQNLVPVEKEEVYTSNWFPIIEFPEELRFHFYDRLMPKNYDLNQLTFPAIPYKNHVCTFAYEYDFMHHLPKTETYSPQKTIRISTKEILEEGYEDDFISSNDARRAIVRLCNLAIDKFFAEKNTEPYQMSNKIGYWFKKGALDKDKHNKVLLVGKQKDKHWHYGLSSYTKLYPFPVLVFNSHIYFTTDGETLIDKASIQHSARRKQGKGWYNDDWKNKMQAFVSYLSGNEDTFSFEVGSEEKIIISASPKEFLSNKSYVLPEKELLDEEVELSDMTYLDSVENEELEEKPVENQ